MKSEPNTNSNSTKDCVSVHVPLEKKGCRLDSVLADLLPDYSRSRLQQWIKQGKVRLDGRTCKPKDAVKGGETVLVEVEPEAETTWQAEAIPLSIVFEDEAIIVLNKPAGLVVHPAAGNWQGTLCNALLHYAPELELVPRAGIVHRLDKDTTGLMVVAKTLKVHHKLVQQLQARAVKREYLAVVNGVMTAGGSVDAPIGRHPSHRTRMAVVSGGKEAVTHYRVLEKFSHHCLLRLRLETGRTHQIRVHLAYIHYPILGDPVYAGRLRLPPGCNEALRSLLQGFKRQALHATRLGLEHPLSGETLSWEVEMPEDMQTLVNALRHDQGST